MGVRVFFQSASDLGEHEQVAGSSKFSFAGGIFGPFSLEGGMVVAK
jgi:hypothetical protein